jgi:hypothetical protein
VVSSLSGEYVILYKKDYVHLQPTVQEAALVYIYIYICIVRSLPGNCQLLFGIFESGIYEVGSELDRHEDKVKDTIHRYRVLFHNKWVLVTTDHLASEEVD